MAVVDYMAMIEELNASSSRRSAILAKMRREAAAVDRISDEIRTRKGAKPSVKKLRLPAKTKAKPRPETREEKMARLKAERLKCMIDEFYNPPEEQYGPPPKRNDDEW